MVFEPVLVLALGMLTAYAVYHSRTLLQTDSPVVPASNPVEGALRVARTRVAKGEIDVAEYERIRAVLCG